MRREYPEAPIVGVGAAKKVLGVRWNVAKDIVVAWILTMPATALIGAGFFLLVQAFGVAA